MNSNIVLSKIVSLLKLEKEEVKLTTARLEDGTVVESDTFDVGQEVFVVGEDGEKSPAPNGEHELFLRDEEGNEVRIRIITEDGVITERENVEELPADEAESLEEEEKEEELTAETTELEEVESEEDKEEEVVINLEEVAKTVEEMSYRIEELEKKLAEMQVEEEVEEEVEAEEEEDLPKLDGAPTELSRVTKPNAASNKIKNRQSAFLSKLYN
jgi:hypothetical protein